MKPENTPNRLVFMDLLRAYAVLMMVQGHTIEVFLKDKYRVLDNPYFNIWNFNRGLTAPIFLFTTGLVFNFLFTKYAVPFYKNPRFLKAIKRALVLLFVSMSFKYPGLYIHEYQNLSAQDWKYFLAVDILQLIALALLVITFLNVVSEALNKKHLYVFGTIAFAFLISSNYINSIYWGDRIPLVFASIISGSTGSQFPIFPWLFYILCGAAIGTLLHNYRTDEGQKKLIKVFLSSGAIITSVLGAAEAITYYGFDFTFLWWTPVFDIFRLGFVFIAVSLFIYISTIWKNVPKIILYTGRNSLWVYLVHIIILYGSAYNFGFNNKYRGVFEPMPSILFAFLMVVSMGVFVYGKEMISVGWKRIYKSITGLLGN